MKPNDKALNEALSVTQTPEEDMREYMRRVLTAAYAAQCQSEDYADIIRALRVMHGTILAKTEQQFRDDVKETMPSKAANAIETLLAKLNSKPKPSEDYAGLIARARKIDQCDDHDLYVNAIIITDLADALEALLAERDALKAENESMRQSLPLWAHKQMAANSALIDCLRTERDALLARLAPVDDKELGERVVNEIRKQLPASGVMYIHIANAARAAIAAIRPHIEAAERERCANVVDEYVKCLPDVITQIAAAIRRGK